MLSFILLFLPLVFARATFKSGRLNFTFTGVNFPLMLLRRTSHWLLSLSFLNFASWGRWSGFKDYIEVVTIEVVKLRLVLHQLDL